MGQLVEALTSLSFGQRLSLIKQLFYRLERRLSHRLLRRYPPRYRFPNLLNLGCGPHSFDDWMNADDYAIKRRLRDRRFRPDWSLDIVSPWRCASDYWDGIFSEHVLEYVTYSESVLVFGECLRTLKPGGWLRISTPDLCKYVAIYQEKLADDQFPFVPHPALAISYLTQRPFQVSVWDADLLVRLLSEVGFEEVGETTFRRGRDERLLRDDCDKKLSSVYVEGRKPMRKLKSENSNDVS